MSIEPKLELIVDELTYNPSDAQKRLKSAFWSRLAEDPILDPTTASLADVQRVLADSRLTRWWSLAGFREWYLNQHEFRDRLEYLSHKVLDSLEEVLTSPSSPPAARVSAAKLIMEAARKMPRAGQQEKTVDLDAKIANMTREQLEKYIQNRVQLLAPTPESK